MGPRVYGGAPKCPTCDKSVYAAEQVIGPAGTYHKLCLKCRVCNKLLEPRLLVDHDGQAYCKACHSKSYGTKGYGVGGALVGEYAPRSVESSPSKSVATSSSPSMPPRPATSAAPAPAVPTRPLFARPSSLKEPHETALATAAATPTAAVARPLPAPPPVPSPTRPPAPSLPARPIPPEKPASFVTRPAHVEAAPPREEAPPTSSAHRAKSGPGANVKGSTPAFDEEDQRGPVTVTSGATGRSSLTSPSALADSLTTSLSLSSCPQAGGGRAGPPVSSLAHLPSRCPACSQAVYHAERVQALGRPWHRACLRCTGCGTGLGSQPGRVEEKEGRPWCRKCYQNRWGITGGMGLSTRPGLY